MKMHNQNIAILFFHFLSIFLAFFIFSVFVFSFILPPSYPLSLSVYFPFFPIISSLFLASCPFFLPSFSLSIVPSFSSSLQTSKLPAKLLSGTFGLSQRLLHSDALKYLQQCLEIQSHISGYRNCFPSKFLIDFVKSCSSFKH